jgi:hypothetical protein
MADAAMQFAFPDHASDLAELLSLADRALHLTPEKSKRKIYTSCR